MPKKKINQGHFLPLPRFPSFCLEGTTERTERGGNLVEQGLGDMGDAVRPESQGIRWWLWTPSLYGVTRCREGGTDGSAMSPFREVGAHSPPRWSIGGSKGPRALNPPLWFDQSGLPVKGRIRFCTTTASVTYYTWGVETIYQLWNRSTVFA